MSQIILEEQNLLEVKRVTLETETQSSTASLQDLDALVLPGCRIKQISRNHCRDFEQFRITSDLKQIYKFCHYRQLQDVGDGLCYIGQWYQNQMHGIGKLIHPSKGQTFEGLFFCGKRHGVGRLIYNNGSVLEGEWFFDKIRKGKYYNSKGLKTVKISEPQIDLPQIRDQKQYIGGYHNGLRDGIGRYQWPDGTFYIGQFNENKMEGYGEMIYINNKIYRGYWSDNKMDGYGHFTWNDGSFYIGQYKQDKKDGFGMMSIKDIIYIGLFKDGNYIPSQTQIIKRKRDQVFHTFRK